MHHTKGQPSTATSHESRPGKPSFCIFWPPLSLASDCGRTDNSAIQGLASPWDTILKPTQDATQQRGAVMTWREAGLSAKGVTNYTTGTRTSIHPDFNPQATQQTRRHTSFKPDRWEYGHAHHPYPRRTQPASTIRPYNPCKTANATAAIWPGGNARAKFRALTLACTTPMIPLGKDTGKPARSSDLSKGQSKECYPGMRHRNCSKNQYQASTKKHLATLRLQQQLITHTPHCRNPPTGQWLPQGGGKGIN